MRTSRDRRSERSDSPIPVVLVGTDPRAGIVARALAGHPALRLVAVVGSKDARFEEAPGVPVRGRAEAFRAARGGVAVLARGHRLDEIEGDLFAAIDAGLSVVGLAEELIHPFFVDPDLAERMDDAAARRGVSVVGVGLHPGFFFDRLPALLAGVVGHPRHLEVERVVDAAKIAGAAGVGLSERAFEEAVEREELGQRGLSEACALAGEALGFDLDEVEESIDPILAPAAMEVGGLCVEAGAAIGLRQIARGFEEGKELVRLGVTFELGARAEDRLRIEATPPVELVVPGGLSEDPALGWSVAHAAARLREAPPGLLSVLDLGIAPLAFD
ncbi:MAG TPA: hypothetical protein VKY51_03930 [Fredinandcohnia sp.]|nr:hypothetical protein [Fredinandcohnia sp.]